MNYLAWRTEKVKCLLILLVVFVFVTPVFGHFPFVEGTAVTPVYRINAGGGLITGSQGNFDSDRYYSPAAGASYSTSRSVSGTTMPALYQSERYGTGGMLKYTIPVVDGHYTVVLHFAEIYWEEAGRRIFDITLEGTKILDNYDIFRKVGAFAATTETFSVNSTGGYLDIEFSSLAGDGGVDFPKVAGIEVLSVTATPPEDTPPPGSGPMVSTLTLIDSQTGGDLQTLVNGSFINLANLSNQTFSIRANTNPVQVGSVVFNLSGAQSIRITENVVPYSLFGDNDGNYNFRDAIAGNYTLTATAYTESNGQGTAGTPRVVNFTIGTGGGSPSPPPPVNGTITGTLKKWQVITLTVPGPSLSQSSSSPNPFLDFRLQVVFTHQSTGKAYNVPGFFDGDGNGGGSGNQWKVRFNPDEEGSWNYVVSFRRGTDVAIDLNVNAGTAMAPDGTAGSFTITGFDPNAPGFQKKGRLNYVGGFYLKFQDGSYWIKGGTDSPENFLGLSYPNHVGDWQAGDPDWNKGMIGALNYLGSMNVNSVYFLPMNIGGDAQDTWPFVGPIVKSGSSSNDNLHYDINKLMNWEQTFQHAQNKGILLHFVLSEAEENNKRELDNGTLGTERKLFYRELVARFGHHNALQWNLCEEYDLSYAIDPNMIKSWAQYMQDIDPYDHPITVHNTNEPEGAFGPFVGDSRFSITSFQFLSGIADNGNQVEKWRNITANAGRPIPISLDELKTAHTGNMADQRKEILWPTYFSGGAGLEYYFGSLDQSLENFRSFASLWQWTWYARKFMLENIPFWEMQPADYMLSGESQSPFGGQVFTKPGHVYAIYLPNASQTGDLQLSGVSGSFQQRWYNPRSGSFEGNTRTVNGGGYVSLGSAPSSSNEDWVVLLTNTSVTGTNAFTKELRYDKIREDLKPGIGLRVKVIANPASQQFTLVTSSTSDQPLSIRVVDHLGRIVESKMKVSANGTQRLGANFFPGIYYAEVLQGKEKVILKLLKQPGN